VDVTQHPSLDAFRAVAAPLYRRDPVIGTLELSVLDRNAASVAVADMLLLTVSDAGHLVGAALHTPPYPLLCTGLANPGAMSVAVDTVTQLRPQLVGVRGLRTAATQFAHLWQSATGRPGVITVEERLYQLSTLRPPGAVPGAHRIAGPADGDIVGRWWNEFYDEAFSGPPGPPRADPVVLWTVANAPVSMAMVRNPSPDTAAVSRIGPVYTPPRYRGHGYGSAVTAAASAWAGQAGAAEVVLFADLANPVSNAIYQRIGFEPVADWARIDFG
jgi:GNAT superfamily N-acetyltransferase